MVSEDLKRAFGTKAYAAIGYTIIIKRCNHKYKECI